SSKAVPDELKSSRNITDQSSLKRVYEYGIGVGGPIKQDKAWFYGTNRWWGADNYAAGSYFNASSNPYRYVPDLSRPAYQSQFFVDTSFRTTWQLTPKNKISHELHYQHGCTCWQSVASASPEAAVDTAYGPQILNQVTWSYPATNKLLLQAGGSFLRQQ